MVGRIPRQALPMLAAGALILPAVIALAVWFSSLQAQRRADVERSALDAARQVGNLVDAETSANRRILELIAAEPSVQDTARVGDVFRRSIANNLGWTALVLREVATGDVLVEVTGRADTRDLRALPGSPSAGGGVEGVYNEGRFCPCVIMHTTVPGPEGRVLTLYVDPQRYQQIVVGHLFGTSLTGVVDRDGRFAARSLDFENRVGTSGTRFILEATKRGGEGFYTGITWEGLENYTAYVTTPQTGWSSHVAVDRASIDGPRNRSNLAVGTAILAALLLAAGLTFYAANETRGRRREEQRLVAMQKAEAISHFTSNTVHDFRNILSVIDAGVQLIVRHTKEPKTAERAEGIHEAVERGKRMVNQLLSFVKGDGAEVRAIDLKTLLAGTDELIGRPLGEGITYTWNVAENARYAQANVDQLELALLNLAINARDAMEGAGAFHIEAWRDGDMVALEAGDSGPGVPEGLRDRVFEAYFSTKGDGEGTGIGLAQVAGMARQAGGRVEYRTGDGGGACFVIYLPAAEAPDPDSE